MIRSGLFFATAFVGVVFVASVSPADTTFQGVGLYQSFDELTAWVDDFEAANSDIVEVVEYGRSHQDRPLLAIQISLTPGVNNSAKPEFLFTGGVHAREVIGSEASYLLAQRLVDRYRAGDATAADILAEREVWILPNMNPDGRVRVEGGYSRQRKTMELFSGQNPNNYQRGVDLNRNFPHRWINASNSVTSETYRGPGVLSTPEAATFWTLLHDDQYFSNIMAAIDFHSGIESILTPWISSATNPDGNPLPPADREKFDHLADVMNDLTGFAINDLSYNAYGTLTDSLYEEFDAYALCVELYKGPWISSNDCFKYFNPVNQAGIDIAVDNAIDSSMFLLSDAAFAMVPEPSVLAMLFLGGIALWVGRCQKTYPPVPLAASHPASHPPDKA